MSRRQRKPFPPAHSLATRSLHDELEPFLKAALPLLPKSKRRITIHQYRVDSSKVPDTDASITTYDFKKYRINIRTHGHVMWAKGNRKFEVVGQKLMTRENILLSLAHEIAHTVEWEHTPDHFALMARILTRFTKVLRRLKVTATDSRRRIPSK